MKTAISAILGTVLFFQFLASGLAQIPEEKCIDFESLPFNVNFTETIEPGDVLLEEDGVIITAEELYGRFDWSMVLNSPNCRPSVYNGRHLVMNHGIQLDFTRLPKQPNLTLFSVGVCDGIQFIRVNNGKIIEIPSNSTFNKEVSLGVTVLYQDGNFIVEGPIQQLFYGGFETGIDLICFEFPAVTCELRDLVIEPYECDDSTYFVDLDFNHSFSANDSFCIIQTDSSYGPFAYNSLPVTLGPLSKDCDTIAEFLIRDKADTTCTILGNAGFPCCVQCELFDLNVEVIECISEELIKIAINFEHQNAKSDFFNLYGNNNQLIGRFEYGSLPLTIANYPIRYSDFQFLKVCDSEDPDCCTEIEFPTPECPELCDIRGLRYDITDCENDSFSIIIDFDIFQPQSDSFIVAGNGRLEGPFAYGDMPLRLGPYPGDCETEYEYVIWDAEFERCSAVIELGKVCCGATCEIGELVTEISDCENDSFVIHLTFKYNGNLSDSFYVLGNGRREGPFSYENLPIVLGPYPGDCETEYEIAVVDSENDDCRRGKEIGKVCCGREECIIRELAYEKSRCENDSFYLHINFVVENSKADGFLVLGNGRREGPFSYRSLPLRLGPYAANCDTEYEFVVQDREDPDCRGIIELGKVCCEEECEISELEAEVLGCNSETTYTVRINFNHQGTNNSGYDIYNRDGFWAYVRGNPPFNLIEFPKSGARFDLIKVCANDKPDCCRTIEIRSPDCEGTNVTSTATPDFDVQSYWDGNELIISVDGTGNNDFSLRLFDISGRSPAFMTNIMIPPDGYRWNLADFPPGLYFLMIQSAEFRITRKVFKGN